MELDAVEARVLGCLVEKAFTTPDVYPLTVNSLLAACNQTTNRSPVVRYQEDDVLDALVSLREKGLTRIVYSPSNRAPKHRHVADESLAVDPAGLAVLCVLLLRGPQTVGEVKARTERLHPFADLAEAEATLEHLAARDEPLAVRLPRLPGQKDARYAHLLSGPVDVDPEPEPARPARAGASDVEPRVVALEAELAALRSELAAVVAVVDRLRALLD
jgi:uncharacterized protein YceH (UPF0502 family)